MQSITKEYLTDIISRLMQHTIHIHRQTGSNLSFYDTQKNWPVTDEEIVEFIFMIPYFDIRLKDFLLGNVMEQTVIISQSWEIEFIKKCMLWSESAQWLIGKHFLDDPDEENTIQHARPLTLPY